MTLYRRLESSGVTPGKCQSFFFPVSQAVVPGHCRHPRGPATVDGRSQVGLASCRSRKKVGHPDFLTFGLEINFPSLRPSLSRSSCVNWPLPSPLGFAWGEIGGFDTTLSGPLPRSPDSC